MTSATAVPSASFVAEAKSLLPLIRSEAAEAEREGRVTDTVIEAYRATRLPRMVVTTELGGGGVRVPGLLPVIRELSRADGGIGWALSFAATGTMFGFLLEKGEYDQLFSDPMAGIGGAFSPFSVSADAIDGGYMVSGRSSNNSAHRLASHLFFGGIVRRGGNVTMTNGVPEVRGFLVPKDQARIIPNWNTTAMCATESDDAEVANLFVPDGRTFALIDNHSPWRGGAESVIPMLSTLGPGLAAQATGIARGALDVFRELASTKVAATARVRLAEQPGPQLALAEAEGLLMAAIGGLQTAVDEAWERGDAGEPFGELEAARLRMASVTAVRLSKRAVELIRDYAGMSVVLKGSQLERFCRDIGAISQHVAVAAGRFEPAGRIFMGLPAGTPMI